MCLALCLQSVAVVRVEISIPATLNLLHPLLLRESLTLLILTLQQSVKGNLTHHCQSSSRQRTRKTNEVFTIMLGLVDLSNDQTSAVTDRLVHTNSHGTLVVRSMAIEQPSTVQADDDVCTGGDEEEGEVENFLGCDWKTDVDGVAGGGDDAGWQHEEATALPMVGGVGDGDVGAGCPEEDGDGEKLGCDNGVAEAADDEGEEAGDTKRADVGHELVPAADVKPKKNVC